MMKLQNEVAMGTPANEDSMVLKLINILFLSHRIQAKLFKTDTIESFLDRVSISHNFHQLYFEL